MNSASKLFIESLKIKREEFNKFLNYIKEDYKNINLNDEIIYWMEKQVRKSVREPGTLNLMSGFPCSDFF